MIGYQVGLRLAFSVSGGLVLILFVVDDAVIGGCDLQLFEKLVKEVPRVCAKGRAEALLTLIRSISDAFGQRLIVLASLDESNDLIVCG